MKRIYLILVLILLCFVCNAQSEDNSCRNRLKKAQNEYKNGDKEKAKKSIQAIIDYCDDATSSDAKKWLEDRKREEQERILAEQKAEQERIKREKEEEEARKKIAEQKKKETYSKNTGSKSSFWDDVAYYFEDPFEGLADYGERALFLISVSEIYPVTLSRLNVGYGKSDYFSLGEEYGFDVQKGEVRNLDYDPTFYWLCNYGFNTRFLSLYCGIGPAYFRGKISWLGDKEYRLGHCLFLIKPSVSLNIPLGDENSLHLNCGYFIFPSKSQLNCLSLGLGFSFE